MYKLWEKHCTNWYASYLNYKKYAQFWRCRINVSNIIFKHILLFNKDKMRYFKIIQRHSTVTMALPVMRGIHTVPCIAKYTHKNARSTLSHNIRSCNQYFYVRYYPQKHFPVILASLHLH